MAADPGSRYGELVMSVVRVVEYRWERGEYTTMQQVCDEFPGYSRSQISAALHRAAVKYDLISRYRHGQYRGNRERDELYWLLAEREDGVS